MALTNRIKVNSVRVGDPNLTVQFQVEDTGVFTTFVQVQATVTLPGATSPTSVNGIGRSDVSPNTSTVVTVKCVFPDGSYLPGQTFGYNIVSVGFSDSGTDPWTLYSGPQDGISWNSTVQSSTFPIPPADEAVRSPTPAGNTMSFWDRIVQFFRRLFG